VPCAGLPATTVRSLRLGFPTLERPGSKGFAHGLKSDPFRNARRKRDLAFATDFEHLATDELTYDLLNAALTILYERDDARVG
jgi:hypothetical protein